MIGPSSSFVSNEYTHRCDESIAGGNASITECVSAKRDATKVAVLLWESLLSEVPLYIETSVI